MLSGLVVEAWIRGADDASRTAARGRGFSLPVLLAILGVAAWLAHVAYFEPRRSHQRSLDGVAAVFGPHIADDDMLYVDTWDGNASLFFRLSRPASIWRLSDPAPARSFKVVVVDAQIEELQTRKDLELVPLETAVTPQGFRYALVEVRRPAADP